MTCDFVGHPVTTEPVASPADAARFRSAFGIAADAPLILGLPGSRKGEVARLGAIFGDVFGRVVCDHPTARIVVPTVAARAEQVRALVADWPGAPVVLAAQETPSDTKRAAFRAADVALAASGTVSLELAAAGTPMVIAYRLNPLSQALIARLLRVDTVTLVNLVSETRAVPEFLGARCTPEVIAPVLGALLGGGDQHEAQTRAMALTMSRLGQGGEAPGLRAARSVLAFLGA